MCVERPGLAHHRFLCIKVDVINQGPLLPSPVSKRVGTWCRNTFLEKRQLQLQDGPQASQHGQLDVVVEHVRALQDDFRRALSKIRLN